MTILEKLIKSGDVYIEKNGSLPWYYGKASDGVHVSLGEVGHENQINDYLKTHASPEDW